MEIVEAYRVIADPSPEDVEQAPIYRLEQPAQAPGSTGIRLERVRVLLGPGVRVSRSATGQLLLYREHYDYGLTLNAALRAGWCRVDEG